MRLWLSLLLRLASLTGLFLREVTLATRIWPKKMATDIIDVLTHGEVENLRDLFKEIATQISEDHELINNRNDLGKSALDVASMLGKTQMLQELILHGADVNRTSSSGIYNPKKYLF